MTTPMPHDFIEDSLAKSRKSKKSPPKERRKRETPALPFSTLKQTESLRDAAEEVEETTFPLLAPLMDPHLPDSLFPLGEIADVLTEARSKEDIFQAIQSPVMEFFERHALFINRNDVMVGHSAAGNGLSKEMIEGVAIPLKVPSIFKECAGQRTPIFGPLPEGHNNRRIATLLKMKLDSKPFLLCPIPLVTKVGVMVFADHCRDEEGVAMRLDKFRKLMSKAGLAFQVLVLKQKILHL
jgi:hypothetical protein